MRFPSLERVAHVALVATLAFAVLWRGGKGIEATWLLVGVGCILVLVSFASERREGRSRLDVPPGAWLAGTAFLLWSALSFALSRTPNYGYDEVLKDGTLLLLVFWSIRYLHGARGEGSVLLRRITQAIVFLTIAAAALGVAVYVFQPVNRFVGSFFYLRFATDYWPNAWAEFLLLAWPAVLWWAWQTSDGIERRLRIGIIGLVLGSLLLSFSRGAVIAFTGQIVLFFALAWPAERRNLRRGIGAAAAIAAVAIAMFLGANALRGQFFPVESVTKKVTFTAAEGTSSFHERWEFFGQALEMAMQRPMVGWGPYSFRFVQPRFQQGILETSDHPHNVVLKIAAERGFPAAAFYVCFIALLLIPCIRTRGRKHLLPDRFLPLALFIGACGVLAHNLIDYNLQFAGIALPLALALGAAGPPAVPLSPRLRTSMRTVEIVLASLLLIAATLEMPSLVLSSLGRHAAEAGRHQEALQWFSESQISLFPRDLALSQATLYLDANLYFDAERILRRYVALNAEDARGWQLLGVTETRLFRTDDAWRSYAQAYVLGRFNAPGITVGYVRALTAAGKRDVLQLSRDDVLALHTAFADAILRNAHFIALSRSVEQFDELSRVLTEAYPDAAKGISALNARVQQHAKLERAAALSARPGYLW